MLAVRSARARFMSGSNRVAVDVDLADDVDGAGLALRRVDGPQVGQRHGDLKEPCRGLEVVAGLHRAGAGVQAAAALVITNAPPELSAVELRAALDSLGRIVGATDTEEILGGIFSRFCIGK